MKVAYVVSSENARKIVRDMILPQLEEGRHGVEVVGMFFVFENTFQLLNNTDLGSRLQELNEKQGTILLACDQCVYEREIEDKLIPAAAIGCFPLLYECLSKVELDQVITI